MDMRQKNFNRQVKNNAGEFEGDDFMFQLTKDEFQEIMECKNFTSSWGVDRRTEPWRFSESGIFMLMTVLKGLIPFTMIDVQKNVYSHF